MRAGSRAQMDVVSGAFFTVFLEIPFLRARERRSREFGKRTVGKGSHSLSGRNYVCVVSRSTHRRRSGRKDTDRTLESPRRSLAF